MTEFNLFSKAPNGELHTKWEEYKKSLKKLAPEDANKYKVCLLYTSPSPRDSASSRMPSSA